MTDELDLYKRAYAMAMDALYATKDAISFGKVDAEELEGAEKQAQLTASLDAAFSAAAHGCMYDLRNPHSRHYAEGAITVLERLGPEAEFANILSALKNVGQP